MPHVVITGCTHGLGRAMTLEFHRLGWQVSGCGRQTDALNALQQEIHSPSCLHTADVTDSSSLASFAQKSLRQFGPPQLLLNNAATIHANAPLWQIPEQEFDQTLQVNLGGTFRTIRAFLPSMIGARKGLIVNFSSGWGRSTSPEVSGYCATKWGIEGLTRSFAQELPPPLAAVTLNPGIIDTRMLRSCFGDDASHYPTPTTWARTAVPFLLQLTHHDNGRALTAPGG